ncbi:sialate O-acetylesterase [Anaerobacillus alkaliphilus]|uniref:Sialate O-acetylesterase n=1 Tax=Anaerobacillus alkaliphilus TaxID=1548597 RepID=A0A4Q0VSE1_9BACI|nr:sialate O-acetylesterase [Anaerobacillus alkaliphilus]RXJ00256.1 sialate O-acetylesterase [Anaerobacillus alkaliphilus]
MKLSSIISDGMVLQRNQQLNITGKTTYLHKVILTFLGKSYETTADNKGDWSITLEPLEPGGPFHMVIASEEEKKEINDILVGDVWVLGGQSNMELPVSRTLDLFLDEIKEVNQPFIRQYNVPQTYDFHEPKQELVGNVWMKATSDDIMKFSAVGYFFAKEIYEKNGVPLGLIMAAVGGTPIEAWISEKTLREIGGYEAELDLSKNDSYIASTKSSDQKRQDLWYQYLNENDPGLKNTGWFSTSHKATDWKAIEIPNSWKGTELEQIRGSVWFRKEVEVPASMLEGEAKLALGTIVDADETYVNGTKIGSTGYRYPPRRYHLPSGILKPGKNSITVRVISTQTTGEFIKDMPYKLMANGQELNLEGTWQYKVGVVTDTLESPTFFQYKPSGVYNAMIAPLKNYPMKGVLWYQGESNTNQPEGYTKLFHALVNDWRNNWQIDEFPFIYTQLANFDPGETEVSNNWAILREEQRKALEIPNTAMAVTIDLGQYNELHPQDKKTVGKRLALCARKLAYEEDIVFSGPIYQEIERVDNSIQLTLDHVGSGLAAKNGNLKQFTICGKDGIFLPATATIVDDKIVVSHEQISGPKHVRYAWANNPDGANLYNKEGLPASPFTTETN